MSAAALRVGAGAGLFLLLLVALVVCLGNGPVGIQGSRDALEIARPPAGAIRSVDVIAGSTFSLAEDVTEGQARIDGDDLVVAYGDGARLVLRDLFAPAQRASVRLLIGGEEVSADDLYGRISEIEETAGEVAPAAGEEAPPPATPELSGLRHTGRDLLFPGEAEREGHPLYSYLLFAGGSHGGHAARERFRRAIEAYVSLVSPAAELERSGAAMSEINLFYAPVRPFFEDTRPESLRIHFAQRSADEQAALLQQYYDYARAEVLMARAGLAGGGPFIVSVLRPLGRELDRGREPFIVQDLSAVPPALVALWITEFKRQVVREAVGSPERLRRLALGLRTQIAVLAEAFAITRSAVAEIIETSAGSGSGGN